MINLLNISKLKSMARVIISLFFIVSYVHINAQESPDKELDAFLKSQLENYKLVALSAGIVKDKSFIWSGAYGYKNIDTKELISPNTLSHQGSISKTITLAAFLHLCEKKQIDLNESINKYLPLRIEHPKYPRTDITFYMLLTHTASLNDVNISKRQNKMAVFNGFTDMPDKLGELIKSVLCKDGEFYSEDFYYEDKPGTNYSYSNIGYSLIGYLIEQISGETFTEYCRKNIFKPLKMEKSTFLLSKTDTLDFAYQYSYDEREPEKLIKIRPYTWAGYMDGSLRTNTTEYANFLIMLINRGKFDGKQVLAESSLEKMLEIQQLPGKQQARMFQPVGRALLWNKVIVSIDSKNIEIYHFNGFGSGFFTEVFFSPDAKIGGMFYITGQFKSFPLMGQAVKENIMKMLDFALKS